MEDPYKFKAAFKDSVKDTVEDELADTAIRILDYLYHKSNDYIILREYIHSDLNDGFPSSLFAIAKAVADRDIKLAFNKIEVLARKMEIRLDSHMELKNRYNSLRGKMHGGKKY